MILSWLDIGDRMFVFAAIMMGLPLSGGRRATRLVE